MLMMGLFVLMLITYILVIYNKPYAAITVGIIMLILSAIMFYHHIDAPLHIEL